LPRFKLEKQQVSKEDFCLTCVHQSLQPSPKTHLSEEEKKEFLMHVVELQSWNDSRTLLFSFTELKKQLRLFKFDSSLSL
jgi:hypothetical protein